MNGTRFAVHITSQTLLGVPNGPYPLESGGNCFSVECDDGNVYRIVNFVLENLKEAVRRGVPWPIKVRPISESFAVVHDERIPDDWYRNRWCETCCPESLLPVTQQLQHERHEACGARERFAGGIMIDRSKLPTLPKLGVR